MSQDDGVCTGRQACDGPFTPCRRRTTLIQSGKRYSIDHSRHISQTGTRLINNAQLIANKAEGDSVVQNGGNMQSPAFRAWLTGLADPIS